MSKVKSLSVVSKNEANEVQRVLNEALGREYDEVFIVGVKDRRINVSYSGFSELERKLGALELLKLDMHSKSWHESGTD